MKRILLLVSALAITFSVCAQNAQRLLSSIEKAELATQDAKKNVKPATWIKLGDSYLNAYNSLKGVFSQLQPGYTHDDVRLYLTTNVGNLQSTVSEKKIYDNVYTVESYDFVDLYYNAEGRFEFLVINKNLGDYSVEALLGNALQAYEKATEIDASGSKAKELSRKLGELNQAFNYEAVTAYNLGDMQLAAGLSAGAVKCSDNPARNVTDTLNIRNSALFYLYANDLDKAEEYFERSLSIGDYQDGSINAYLADILSRKGETDRAKEILNDAFVKFPNSQSVLISLINLYQSTNDDPEKVLELVRSAQANDPDNPQLYYTEGNVYKELGEIEKARECYYKSYEVDPAYAWGLFEVGETYFDEALKIQKDMNALDYSDIAGYESLSAKFEETLLQSIEPYEKAFAIATDAELKSVIASNLKNIYFRFREKDPKFMEGYEKCNAYLQNSGAAE